MRIEIEFLNKLMCMVPLWANSKKLKSLTKTMLKERNQKSVTLS